jgi:hypothetical protein
VAITRAIFYPLRTTSKENIFVLNSVCGHTRREMNDEDIGLIQGLFAEHRDWGRTRPLFFFEMLPQGWLSSFVLVAHRKSFLMSCDLAVSPGALLSIDAVVWMSHPFSGSTMANILVMDAEQPFVICPIHCSAANAGSLIIRAMRRAIWSLLLNNASTDVIP